jgi:hypothetical protein
VLPNCLSTPARIPAVAIAPNFAPRSCVRSGLRRRGSPRR